MKVKTGSVGELYSIAQLSLQFCFGGKPEGKKQVFCELKVSSAASCELLLLSIL